MEATRRLREQERAQGRPPVPVVAVTASVLDHDRAQAFAAGMNDFVMKPVSRERLFAILSKWVGADAGTAQAGGWDDAELPRYLIDDGVVGTAWGGRRELWLAAVQDVMATLDQVVFTADIGRASQQTLGALAGLVSDARNVGAHAVAAAAEACVAEWGADTRQPPSLAGLLALTSAARECIEFALANHLMDAGTANAPGAADFRHMPVWLRERMRVHVVQWRKGFFNNSDRELLAALRPYTDHQQHLLALEALENFDADELVVSVAGVLDPPASNAGDVSQPL
jgi:CheY-like chemotaxis protein